MDTDHKLLCLLSKLRSMFPRDTRLGVAPYRIRQEKKEKSPEEKNQELIDEFENEIYNVMRVEWKQYEKNKRVPKDKQTRNQIKLFLKTLCLSWIGRWRIRRDNNEKNLKAISVTLKLNRTKKEEAVRKKTGFMNEMKARIQFFGNKKQRFMNDEKYIAAEIKMKEQQAIIDSINLNEPEQLYVQEFIDCKHALADAEKRRDAKKADIFRKQQSGESDDILKAENENYGYMIEDCCILQKIHDDFLSDQLDKIKKGKLKRRDNQ